ncbi:hypothetical protein FQZ97_1210210 [compost metagenome]
MLRRQPLGFANDQFDLGRTAQRLQFDLAIRGTEAPGQQPRQHARIPGLIPGAEQADAPRRTLDQRPAAQHAEVRVAGTDEQ